jgi:hypothetical protein
VEAESALGSAEAAAASGDPPACEFDGECNAAGLFFIFLRAGDNFALSRPEGACVESDEESGGSL